MANILIVDDELGIRELLSDILGDEGHTVELAENAAQAREALPRFQPELVLLDIWMPDTDGVTLLKEWSATGQLRMPVVMMSGHATIDTAVEATRIGAMAFLEKPVTLQKLLKAVEQALNKKPAPPVSTPAGTIARPLEMRDLTVEQAMLGGSAGGTTARPLAAASAPTAGIAPPAAPQGNVANAAHQLFSLDRPLREARDAFEKAYFEFHLSAEGGSMTRVAEKTGLERTHLYRKLKQLGVDLSRSKRGG
jgi:DNA-binding NtrC family response regulator